MWLDAVYLLNAEVGIEVQVNAKIALRLVAKDARTPAAGRERNDLSVIGARRRWNVYGDARALAC
ncbi:MAG: hypothetical protein O3B24_09330 [Verrucomicrobia bacterium]|nr:hypothetical protein [Verrucomicrobiota bacterium]